MTSEQIAYDELCCYTLAHRHPSFIHQHVTDAFTAQHASHRTRPITLTFALVGLYLFVEKQFSGKQVQRAHMKLARSKQSWRTLMLPCERGSITAIDVVAAAEGAERDDAIRTWCASVWSSYYESRPIVIELLGRHGVDDDSDF